MDRNDPRSVDERSFKFFCDVSALGGALGSSSRREFIRYNEIALRSANESARWLRWVVARRLANTAEAIRLLDEARQLARMLARIVITAKRNEQPGGQ